MTNEETIEGLRAELTEAKKDAASWKSHWQMYRNAWVRELGGWTIPKAHEIDSLVLTTRKRCVNPLLGNCITPHWLGKPTADRKALVQTPHPRESSCKDWKFDDSGAAVSASPQPSVEVRELMRGGENGWGVPQHEVVLGKLRIGVFSNKDSADKFAADVRALEKHRCPDGAIDEIESSMANLDRVIRKLRSSEPATPASTARTDEPSFATNETEQRQIDIINLRLYARLAEENEWKDDVLHWSVFQQTLEAIATRLERLPLPAAPGSVPQAPDQSAALRTALEALAQDYKEEVRNAEASFAYMNAMEVLGVPQAEPPKEDVKEVEFTGSWLDMAICIAVKSHAGQLDKSRKPYILHPLRVMAAVAQEGEAAMIAAVLHDAVEDTELSLESVKEQFGDEVASMVDSLSRRKGKETYREFIQRVKLNPMAAKIKIADLHDNLSRIENLEPNERSIRHRYEKALIELAGDAQPGDDKPGGAE